MNILTSFCTTTFLTAGGFSNGTPSFDLLSTCAIIWRLNFGLKAYGGHHINIEKLIISVLD